MKDSELRLHLKYIDDCLRGLNGTSSVCPDCGRMLDTKTQQWLHLRLKVCVKSRCNICGRDLLHHSCPKWHWLEPPWFGAHVRHCFTYALKKRAIKQTPTPTSCDSTLQSHHPPVSFPPFSYHFPINRHPHYIVEHDSNNYHKIYSHHYGQINS